MMNPRYLRALRYCFFLTRRRFALCLHGSDRCGRRLLALRIPAVGREPASPAGPALRPSVLSIGDRLSGSLAREELPRGTECGKAHCHLGPRKVAKERSYEACYEVKSALHATHYFFVLVLLFYVQCCYPSYSQFDQSSA